MSRSIFKATETN